MNDMIWESFSHQIRGKICWWIKGKSWMADKIGFSPKQAKNQISGKKIFLIKAWIFFYNCKPNMIHYISTWTLDQKDMKKAASKPRIKLKNYSSVVQIKNINSSLCWSKERSQSSSWGSKGGKSSLIRA